MTLHHRAMFPIAEQDSAILLGLREADGEGRFNAYRIFSWMLSHEISAQIHHVKERPLYILHSMQDFTKLVNAIDKDAKGRLEKPNMSVAVPHYKNPLDEVS